MTEVAQDLSRPRTLSWTAAFLASLAWCAALGMMSWLIDGPCVMLWMSVAACIALSAAPAVFLGRKRRSLDSDSDAALRARLVLDLAVAGSVVLALVMLAMAVPIVLQNACSA